MPRGRIYRVNGGGLLIKFPSHVKISGRYALVRINDKLVIARVYRLRNHSTFCNALYISSLEAPDIECRDRSDINVDVVATFNGKEVIAMQ